MPDETFRWVVAGGVAIATLSMVVMAVLTIVMFRVISRLQEGRTASRIVPNLWSTRFVICQRQMRRKLAISSLPRRRRRRTRATFRRSPKIRLIVSPKSGAISADRAKAQVARVDAAVDDNGGPGAASGRTM